MSDRPEKKVNSKKLQRLESKKRKAIAFLDLVKPTVIGPEEQSNSSSVVDSSSAGNMTSVLINPLDSTSAELKPENPPDEDVLQQMKMIVRERKKASMAKPRLFLTLEDMVPYHPVDVPIEPSIIPPLYVMDLQQLLLYGIQGNVSSFKPRWCKLVRVGKVSSVVVILIDGIGYSDYMENKECFPYITESFSNSCEMVCPMQYNRTVAKELHCVPLSVSQLKKANVKVPQHIRELIAKKLAKPSPKPSEIEDTKSKPSETEDTKSKPSEAEDTRSKPSKQDKFPRKCLLLSTQQMMHEGYPLPIVTRAGNYQGFVFSKKQYKKVSDTSPLVALDCEMCLTNARKNELTRVSIVSESGELIYDKLVKPHRTIINYLTKWSGITKEMLDPVTTRITDVQREIQELLPADAIMCGQSLNSDLVALKMFHPYVIDTSVIYNMSGIRRVKAGLRKLTQFFLGRAIQDNPAGHCSHQDAEATLDLVKLKLTKGLEFGDATLNGIYFPDITTYFLDGSTATKKPENHEADTPASTKPISIETNSGKEKLRLEESKKAGVECNDSSDVSDDDEEDAKSDEPPSKKVKSEDNSIATQSEFFKAQSTSYLLEEQTNFLFSQDNSVHINQSFFRLVYEAGRSACVIDREAVTSNFMKEPIDVVTVENDSMARKIAKKEIKSKSEFLWVNFHEIADAGREETIPNKLMRKMDHRVKSVLKHVKENTLAVVVMTGHKDKNQLQNMMTFMKTT